MLERRPVRLATVALANKMARIAWALMTREEVYRPRGVRQRPTRELRRDAPAQDGRRRAQARLIRQEALTSVMGKAVVKTVQAIPIDVSCLEHAIRLVPDT